jgi:hypothetical protein
MTGALKDGLSSLEILSDTFSGSNSQGVTGSFGTIRVTTLVATGQVTGGATVGSPSVNGAFVQAGEGGPLLAATGSLVFGRLFTDSSYKLVISPQISGTLPWAVASGTGTYSTSGATVTGQSGLKFNWIAVGT